jgi:hypothetical protein
LQFSEKIQGLTASDTGQLFLYSSVELFEVAFKPNTDIHHGQRSIPDVMTQLRHLQQTENDSLRFVETATILQQNPTLAERLLPLLAEQFSEFPDEMTIEKAALLLHQLKASKAIDLVALYHILLKNGKEKEMWRFISAYDTSQEPFILRIPDECRLTPETVNAMIGLIRGDSSRIPIARLLDRFPDVASSIYRHVRDMAAPFILLQLKRLNQTQLREIQTAVSGSGSILEFSVQRKTHSNSMVDPFYFLNEAKMNGDWEIGAQIASELGLEDEYRFCKSKQNTASDLRSKLLKRNLDFSEQNEILMQFVQEFEKADSSKTFEDYSVFAKSIARRLDLEMNQIREKRIEASRVLESLAAKRFGAPQRDPKSGLKRTSICSKCRKLLGKGTVIIFPCGHYFHVDCKKEFDAEFAAVRVELKRKVRDVDEGCPLCGPPSAILVHKTISGEGWDVDP